MIDVASLLPILASTASDQAPMWAIVGGAFVVLAFLFVVGALLVGRERG